MEVRGNLCYFHTMKRDSELQGALSIFRLWQKQHILDSASYCHLHLKNDSLVITDEAKQIIESSFPILEEYINYSILLIYRTESIIEQTLQPVVCDNNIVLENIVNEIFTSEDNDAVDDTPIQSDMM